MQKIPPITFSHVNSTFFDFYWSRNDIAWEQRVWNLNYKIFLNRVSCFCMNLWTKYKPIPDGIMQSRYDTEKVTEIKLEAFQAVARLIGNELAYWHIPLKHVTLNDSSGDVGVHCVWKQIKVLCLQCGKVIYAVFVILSIFLCIYFCSYRRLLL